MTPALARQLTLTDDQLHALTARAGTDGLPTVLGVRAQHATIDRREAAHGQACRELISANLIVDGAVHPEVVAMLQALQRPDRELAMRLVTPEGMARVSVVRRGSLCVLARRIGDEVTLRTIAHSTQLADVVPPLRSQLPQSGPADIAPVGAPLQDMSHALSDTDDPLGLADRIRALGTPSDAAMLLGTALASRQAYAEIVYYALDDDEDRISRAPAAVAVFYTKRGRIIAAPSASPTGQLWTTLKAGSDHVFGKAISGLVGLCDHRWEDT
jgi:hypothetical protein